MSFKIGINGWGRTRRSDPAAPGAPAPASRLLQGPGRQGRGDKASPTVRAAQPMGGL